MTENKVATKSDVSTESNIKRTKPVRTIRDLLIAGITIVSIQFVILVLLLILYPNIDTILWFVLAFFCPPS